MFQKRSDVARTFVPQVGFVVTRGRIIDHRGDASLGSSSCREEVVMKIWNGSEGDAAQFPLFAIAKFATTADGDGPSGGRSTVRQVREKGRRSSAEEVAVAAGVVNKVQPPIVRSTKTRVQMIRYGGIANESKGMVETKKAVAASAMSAAASKEVPTEPRVLRRRIRRSKLTP
jgi:hypothetical protein